MKGAFEYKTSQHNAVLKWRKYPMIHMSDLVSLSVDSQSQCNEFQE